MKIVRALLILIAGALILAPPETQSCGPFLPVAQFRYVLGPQDTRAFNRGMLGIVAPKYYRRNLIVAYRYFSGAPLTKEEIAAIAPRAPTPAEETGAAQPFSYDTPQSARVWLTARNAIPGVQPLTKLVADRVINADGYEGYQNCLDDAFLSAAATLKQRVAKWRADSPQVAEWIRGQDQVFQSCSEGAHIPADLPAGSDPLLAADRRYQIAAAEFYAKKFDDAQRDFQALGLPYLVARTLIRKATIGGDSSAMAAAEKELQAILKDPARKQWHDRTRGLLEFVHARLDPEARMVEVGEELVKPAPGAKFARNMTDFTALWDKLDHGPAERNELADWITAYQDEGDAKHAVDRWRTTRNAAWLVAALRRTSAKDAEAGELVAAARQLPPENPAYLTAAYLALNLQISGAPDDATREWLDRMLATKQSDDTHNGFQAQRLALARNWEEFLRYSPTKPVAVETDEVDESLNASQVAAGLQFDSGSAELLNRYMPLPRWVDASQNPLLPKNLQTQVAQAGWVRAVVVDQPEDARKLATRLGELRPELAQGLRAYLGETDPAAAKFAAVFLMLRYPGFDIRLRPGYPRDTKIDIIDDFRDNWWNRPPSADEKKPAPPPPFLSAEERAAGEKEAKDLATAAPVAPNYLSGLAIDWARKHPDDARVPEALHLAVRATRFGITDKETTTFSKAAFQLLHSRYPNSKWTGLTKYWY